MVTIENRVFAGDGRIRWMEFVNRGFFDGQGSLLEIQSVGRDITVRKEAEQALAASRLQLRALLEANDTLLEAQRRDIAREVHDQLGAALTAVGFRVDALSRLVGENQEALAEAALIKSLVTKASGAARDISSSLRPPTLDDLGLVETCRWYLKDWGSLVAIRTSGRFGRLSKVPSERQSIDVFRVFQELLTNIARHAGATRVQVSLSGGSRGIQLRVADNGGGFDVASRSAGFGLAGVRERMARHGGRVVVLSGSTGTTVTLTLPWSRGQ